VVTVFDIGMYDGADTAYYLQLESGNRVVAVEANPELVQRANERFRAQIASGHLICLGAAISSKPGPVELVLSGEDLGASSVFSERVANRRPICSITVPGLTMHELLARYGVPHYLKVDIEGADRLCVLSLTSETRPQYLSFEAGADVEELIEHVQMIGYNRFKIINQVSFRELANQRCLHDRAVCRLAQYLGYAEPRLVKRAGRFFASGHSSGPVPWRSDGRWYSGGATLSRWRKAQTRGLLSSAWYDIHATLNQFRASQRAGC
jgi:FkbM family methyltransferase